MCSGSAPAAPKADANLTKAADEQAAIGREYLDFAKEQFKVSQGRQVKIDALTKSVTDHMLSISEGDRKRYEEVFRPLEDRYIKTAEEYDSPERQAEEAARAKASVHTAAAVERGTMERNAASAGIRPDSGRFAGIDRAMGLGTAAASVGAQNQARDAVRDKGLALRRDAIGLGQNLTNSSMNAANVGLNAQAAGNNQFLASQRIVAPGYASAQQGAQGQASTYANLHASNIGIWDSQNRIDAANSAGVGQAIGTGIGMAAMLSTKKAKTNRKKVPEGEALAAVEGMPVEAYDYKPGMGDGGSHVGPMAEDFQRETGSGNGTTIAMQDMLGVTMGAVKDLSSKVDRMAEMIGLGGAAPAPA